MIEMFVLRVPETRFYLTEKYLFTPHPSESIAKTRPPRQDELDALIRSVGLPLEVVRWSVEEEVVGATARREICESSEAIELAISLLKTAEGGEG